MLHFGSFAEDCCKIRQTSPVIHNITNYVAMSISANALLAIGASPIMSSEPEEMEEIVAMSSALTINLGCLERKQIEAMRIAAATAVRLDRPWVLDPVGAGASRLRTGTALELITKYSPSVIRGNASEIMSLAGASARNHGVDSAEESRIASVYAVSLARKYNCIVSTSGPTDYITDGKEIISISNGDPIMPAVTAMGCTASAMTASFLAVRDDALEAAASAMALMGLAGEQAAAGCQGPGSFAVKFIDTLACIDPVQAQKNIRYGQEKA